MTPSNWNVFRVTGRLWGKSTGDRGIPFTKASDAELWCFLWFAPEQSVVQTSETLVIWDTIPPIMTSLQCGDRNIVISDGVYHKDGCVINNNTYTRYVVMNTYWQFICLIVKLIYIRIRMTKMTIFMAVLINPLRMQRRVKVSMMTSSNGDISALLALASPGHQHPCY